MDGTIARDLAILGCCETSTLHDIKTAYRSLARRLHGELHRKMPGANERLVDINTAYDRLATSWAGLPHMPQRRARAEAVVSPTVKDRLQVALRKATFKMAFAGARDPATGVYGDPRRADGANRRPGPHTAMVRRVVRSGSDVMIELDGPLSAGRTLAAVPELVLARDGSIAVGSGHRVLDFFLQMAAQRARVETARIPTSGDTPLTCTLIHPGRSE
ncbi:MAG: DnaJ domain-containing protein [Pseudomonadota bacterium]